MRTGFVLLTLLTLAGAGLAQHCRIIAVHRPAYHAPAAVYHAPVAVQKVVVPVYEHYYTVNTGDYGASLIADAAAFRVLQALRAPGGLQAPGGPAGPLPPGVEPLRAPAPGGGVPAALAAIVEAKCLKCHRTGSNGLNLSDLSAVPRAARLEAWLRVSASSDLQMPPADSGLKLTDTELQPFYEWAAPGRAAAKK